MRGVHVALDPMYKPTQPSIAAQTPEVATMSVPVYATVS